MVRRIFIPGSQWLYFKIYSGCKTADDILTETVCPYVNELYNSGLIDSYFFIRYADPKFHLRLRLHTTCTEEWGRSLAEFFRYFQPYVDNGAVSKIMCDTYIREIERYGENTIEEVEKLFYIDTAAILKLLVHISDTAAKTRDTFRWQTALLLLDDMLTAFGYDISEKMQLLRRLANNFKHEFGFVNHIYTKQLNDKFRIFRKDIERVLSTRADFSACENILQARREQIRCVGIRIKEILESEKMPIPDLDEILSSFQHMTMNRWFCAQNRLHELVIYDFLSKYYESMQIRLKQGIKAEA